MLPPGPAVSPSIFCWKNVSLTYTMASNVSLIISTAPSSPPCSPGWSAGGGSAYTPVSSWALGVAMAGICLISFNSSQLSINPLGDLLALLAALMWAVYSVVTRRISTHGHSTVQTTRRIFPVWTYLYGARSVPYGLQPRLDPGVPARESGEPAVSGVGSFGPVLCGLEFW